MLSGEDFGYLKDEEKHQTTIVAKKILLLAAVLFSISCFVYITINAYYFVYHDQDSDIRVIKSPAEPIKVVEGVGGGLTVKDIDKTVYDNIVGGRNTAKENFNSVKVVEQITPPLVKRNNVEYISTKDIASNIQDNQKAKGGKVGKIDNSSIVIYDANKNSQTSDVLMNKKKDDQQPLANKTTDNVSSSASVQINGQGRVQGQVQERAQTKGKIKGLSRVQIAALTSQASATDYWSKLSSKYPALFSGFNYFIQEVNLGSRGKFYRLQIGNFRSQVDAEEFCSKFISQAGKTRADCIVVE